MTEEKNYDRESGLDAFANSESVETEGAEEKEEKPKTKRTRRKPRKKTSSAKSEPKKTTRKTSKKSPSEQRRELVEKFIRDHTGVPLYRLIALFAKEHGVPRVLNSDIRSITSTSDPYRILEYMHSKKTG